MRHLRRTELRFPGLWRGCCTAIAPCMGNTGLRLHDYSGRNNFATFSGTTADVAWVTSGKRQAISFDGVNDYLTCNHGLGSTTGKGIGSLVGTGIATVSVWINPSTVSVRQALVSDWDTSGSAESFALQIFATGKIGCYVRSPSIAPTAISGISANTWSHVLASASPLGLFVWINGSLQYSNATSVSLATGSFISIGRSGDNGIFYNGLMDDVRIYSRLLGSTEIYLLAKYRGIAYETRRRRSVPVPSSSRRRRLLLLGQE